MNSKGFWGISRDFELRMLPAPPLLLSVENHLYRDIIENGEEIDKVILDEEEHAAF